MIEWKKQLGLDQESKLRSVQERSLTNLGFEKVEDSNFFERGGFVVALERNGQIRLYVDYRGTGKGSIVGVEFDDKEYTYDALCTIEEADRKHRKRFHVSKNTLIGSGSSGYKTYEELANRIERFRAISHVQQLANAGFAEVVPTRARLSRKRTQVFSRSLRTSEDTQTVYSIVKDGKIERIIQPAGRWAAHFITPSTRPVRFSTKENIVGDEESVLTFRNDFLQFNIGSDYGGQPVDDVQLLRELTDEEAGLEPFQPRQEPSGFIVGGVNESALIQSLESINNVRIEELERRMRPGAYARVGFLGQAERLLNVLCEDNDLVLLQGQTHQALAHPLKYAIQMKNVFGACSYLFRGISYKIDSISTMGYQKSPFHDSTASDTDATVTNIRSGERVAFSFLHPHMIERYGFYEGKGTSHRVEPSQIIRVFSLAPESKN